MKHLPGAFAVAPGDTGSMDIYKTVFIEVFVYGETHGVSYTHNRAECVCSGPQMRDLSQKFE